MPQLFLVRHGLSLRDPATPPDTWGLDPERLADIDALAGSGRLPAVADWYSSPETEGVGDGPSAHPPAGRGGA